MYTNIYTEPAAEPATVSDIKTQLRVDYSDDDTLIGNMLKAARVHAVNLSRTVPISTVFDTWLDCWPDDGVIVLPRRPVSAITSITYYTMTNVATVIDAANYVTMLSAAEPKIAPAYGYAWPTDLRARDAILVRYTAGQGAAEANVDKRLRDLIVALVCVWYEARDGISTEQLAKQDFIEWALRQDGY
jgi:uncharacterized phiE125 gp8 family phage protein